MNLTLGLLYKVIYYLLIPLDYLERGIRYLVDYISNLLRGGQPLEPLELPDFLKPPELQEVVAAQGLPPGVFLVLKWVFFAVIVQVENIRA